MEGSNKILTSVRNPLSIIALFVLLIELIASLSTLNNQLTCCQRYWFVVFCTLFPVLVLLVFFMIAWFRPINFYGPQDYTDESIYLQLMKKEKKIDEMEEITKQENTKPSTSISYMTLSEIVDNAEHRAIEELEKEFNSPIITNVRSKDGRYVYDGVIRKGNRTIIIEIKYYQGVENIQPRISSILRFAKSVKNAEKLLAIVTPTPVNEIDKESFKSRIYELDKEMGIRFYTL